MDVGTRGLFRELVGKLESIAEALRQVSNSQRIGKDKTTPYAKGESNIQANQGDPNITPALGVPPFPPTETHYKITCKPEKSFWGNVKTGAELFGIVLLAIYTLYTVKMYCANKEAADAAKSAAKTADAEFHISSRAWMNAVLSNPGGVIDGQPLRIVVDFNNTGKSPAINVQTCQIAKMVKQPVSLDINCPAEAMSPGNQVVLSNGVISRIGNAVGGNNVPPPTQDGLLTSPLHEELRKGKQVAITYGFVAYDDIFKIHHWAKFCSYLKIMPSTRGGLPETTGWVTCEVGNDIDPNYY